MPRRAALACLACLGCSGTPQLPGDQMMGAYAFNAELLEAACEIPEVSGPDFSFQASFSRDSATGAAWFSLNRVLRDAAFDGQVLSTTYEAPRSFGEVCGGCTTTLQESVWVAILSQSQNEAAGDGCPEAALDGGIPAGPGITPPGSVSTGFDAVRACGELLDVVSATALEGQECDVRCGRCALRYRLAGARR